MNLETVSDNQGAGAARAGGTPRQWLPVLGLLIGAFVLFVAYYKVRFAGLMNGDAFDFAQLGRNLSNGKGFVTYILRPLAIAHGADPTKQFDLTHGPLYPFVLAIAYGVAGARDNVTAYISGLFYVLTVPIVYLVGLRSFGQRVGLIAACAFALSATMLDFSISGLPHSFYMFLVACLALAIHGAASQAEGIRTRPGSQIKRSPLCVVGLLTAALYLANPIFAWCLPVVGVAVVSLFPARARASAAFAFCLPLLLVLPWMWRNYSLTSNPVFGLRGSELWMATTHYPGYVAYRYLPEDAATGTDLVLGVSRKLAKQFLEGFQILPGAAFSLLMVFLIPSLLFRFSDPVANAVRRVIVGMFLAIFFGVVVFVMELQIIAVVIPVMLVFSAAFLLYLWDQAQLRGSTAMLAVGLLALPVLCPLASNLLMEHAPSIPVDKPAAMALGLVAKHAHGNIVVLSDQPWIVAWYSGAPAVWLPQDPAKVSRIRTMFPGMHWVFLTQQVRQYEPEYQRAYGLLARWNALYEQSIETGQAAPPNVQLGDSSNTLPALVGFQPVPPPSKDAAITVLATDLSSPPVAASLGDTTGMTGGMAHESSAR